MDYEKILKRIVQIINTTENSDIGFTNICTYIGENCPELEKSEDERIRKELIDYINCLTVTPNNIDRYNSWIAWLEKQVPKSKWTEKDERNLNMAIYFMRSENTPYSPTDVEPVVEWLCWLKQRMEE